LQELQEFKEKAASPPLTGVTQRFDLPRLNLATARKRTVWLMLRLRTGLIDGQIATVYRLAFQCTDGSLTFVTISHGDKSKSTGLTTHPIGYQVHVSDGTVRSEEVAQFAFASGEREITYV
jgi:hypothetical protein